MFFGRTQRGYCCRYGRRYSETFDIKNATLGLSGYRSKIVKNTGKTFET